MHIVILSSFIHYTDTGIESPVIGVLVDLCVRLNNRCSNYIAGLLVQHSSFSLVGIYIHKSSQAWSGHTTCLYHTVGNAERNDLTRKTVTLNLNAFPFWR